MRQTQLGLYRLTLSHPSLRIEDPRGVVLFVGTLAANDLISNAVTALPKNTLKILSWFLDVELSGDWQILTELSHFRVLNIFITYRNVGKNVGKA